MPDDLERLYDAHSAVLHGFLLNLTRDEADTRDLLQEILVGLAKKPDLLSDARDERGFLIRLAHNLALDSFRRRRDARVRRHDRFAADSLDLFGSDDPDESEHRQLLAVTPGAIESEGQQTKTGDERMTERHRAAGPTLPHGFNRTLLLIAH